MTKRISENLPLLSIILIYFGYCNLYIYFKSFKIEIYNYISNSEILLSFLPTIVIISTAIGTIFISFIIGFKQGEVDKLNRINYSEDSQKVKSKPKSFILFIKNPIFLCLFIYLLFLIMGGFFTYFLDYKDYELKIFYLLTSFTVPVFYYFILKRYEFEFLNKFSYIISASIIIFIGTQIGNYRQREAEQIKNGISCVQLSFNYNNQKIETNTNLILIGETQSNLFLFNRTDKSTIIYKREKIDSLIIK